MTRMDEINAKILKELLKDGRKRFTNIAKECNTTNDVIAKRYKQMKKKGIIVGATIQNSSACYGGDIIACIHIMAQPFETGKIFGLIRKIPQVYAVHSTTINPNISVIVILKTIDELDEVKQSITRIPSILGVTTTVWTGIRNTPENLSVLSSRETDNSKIESKMEKTRRERYVKTEIDQVDSQIIEKLAVNGRRPFKKIAEELNISTDTVARRYERLKRNRDLRVVIQINPAKIGYDAFAIFNMAFISQDGLSNYMETLAKMPDINFILKTSGDFDCRVSVMLKDINQLTTIQEAFMNISGIVKMELAVGKAFGAWPLPKELISTF